MIRPDSVSSSLGSARLDDAVRDDARGLLEQGGPGYCTTAPDGERRVDDIGVFVSSYAPRPRMIVFGAIDFAAAVARVGSFLGYRVTVCDARPMFATARRFPDADEVVVEWPHRYLADTEVDERTVLCVLTHDPKFDVPLLEVALRLPVAYVGAMGSRRTQRGPAGPAARARADRRPSWPGCTPRSGSTSAPARPRRPRSRSPPRSSGCGGAAAVEHSATSRARSTVIVSPIPQRPMRGP